MEEDKCADVKSEIDVKHEPLDSETEYIFAETITSKSPRSCGEEPLSVSVEEAEEKCFKWEEEEDPQVIINGFGGIHTIKHEDECPEEETLHKHERSSYSEPIEPEQPYKSRRIRSAIGLPVRVLEDIEEPKKKVIKMEEFDDNDDVIEIDPSEVTGTERKLKNSNDTEKIDYKSMPKVREKSSSSQEQLKGEAQAREKTTVDREKTTVDREKTTVDHAFDWIKAVTSSRDECNTFGEHVANKIRKLDDRARAIIQHKISNMIFEEEIRTFSAAPDCKET